MTISVYVVEQQDRVLTKIGIAQDVSARIRSLQTANPTQLILKGVVICDDRVTAKQIESWLHMVYQDYRVSGEWFSISGDRVLRDYHLWGNILSQPIRVRSLSSTIPLGIVNLRTILLLILTAVLLIAQQVLK